jgi:hypothetical protein
MGDHHPGFPAPSYRTKGGRAITNLLLRSGGNERNAAHRRVPSLGAALARSLVPTTASADGPSHVDCRMGRTCRNCGPVSSPVVARGQFSKRSHAGHSWVPGFDGENCVLDLRPNPHLPRAATAGEARSGRRRARAGQRVIGPPQQNGRRRPVAESARAVSSPPFPRVKVSRSNFILDGERNRGAANDVFRRKNEI